MGERESSTLSSLVKNFRGPWVLKIQALPVVLVLMTVVTAKKYVEILGMKLIVNTRFLSCGPNKGFTIRDGRMSIVHSGHIYE